MIVDTLVGHSVDKNDMARERHEVILLLWGDEKLLRPTDVSVCVCRGCRLEWQRHRPIGRRTSGKRDDAVAVRAGGGRARGVHTVRAVDVLHMLLIGNETFE